MLDTALRPTKDTVFGPLSRMVPLSITPLHVTIVAFLCGLGACTYAVTGQISLSLGLWFLNRALDCLDGAVARNRGQASDFGGFADLLADFIVYSLIPIGCAVGCHRHAHEVRLDARQPGGNGDSALAADLLAIALLEASFHINNFVLFYAGAITEKEKGKSRREDAAATARVKELTSIAMRPALVEGLESGVFFTVMLLLPRYVGILSYAMLVGVVIGTVQRVCWIAAVLEK